MICNPKANGCGFAIHHKTFFSSLLLMFRRASGTSNKTLSPKDIQVTTADSPPPRAFTFLLLIFYFEKILC